MIAHFVAYAGLGLMLVSIGFAAGYVRGVTSYRKHVRALMASGEFTNLYSFTQAVQAHSEWLKKRLYDRQTQGVNGSGAVGTGGRDGEADSHRVP